MRCKTKFKKIYIDAFAGTGEIETSDGEQYLVGSAKRALAADRKFDRYYFIEGDEKKAAELQEMVNAEFPYLSRVVTVYCGDANDKLAQIIRDVDWRYNRGLLFLDPYATQVNWTTLETVARTKSIDVWYLFPFSALNRMLPKNSKYETWENCIDRLLGDDGWQTEFYKEDSQMSLFDLLPDSGTVNSGTRKIQGFQFGSYQGLYHFSAGDDIPLRVSASTDFQEQPELADVLILLCYFE